MGVRLKNVDEIVTSNGETLDVKAAVGVAGSGGSGASANFVATGNISAGQTVGLRTDGTVEAINNTNKPVSTSMGSKEVFEIGTTSSICSVIDTSENRVVIIYRDESNNNYGTAVVGEISGESISFGMPVVFASSNVDSIGGTFDENSKKVVICYLDNGNSNWTTYKVGAVSGNSISFGITKVLANYYFSDTSMLYDPVSKFFIHAYYNSGNNGNGTIVAGKVSENDIEFGGYYVFSGGQTDYRDIAYDSNSNKIICAYSTPSSRFLYATIGTVNPQNKEITFGSGVAALTSAVTGVSVTFDSNENKCVIFYQDDANSKAGTAIVGEVIGDSISFGTPVVFDNNYALGVDYLSSTFDANVNKVLVTYRQNGTNSGIALSGTISGLSISFDSPASYSNNARFMRSIYDPLKEKILLAFQDFSNSSYGTAAVYTTGGISSETNASSWIGISNESIASGSSGSVNLMGSVDSHQSGLTVRETYYLNYDGTLTDTPNEGPKIGTYGKVGMALSPTSIFLSE